MLLCLPIVIFVLIYLSSKKPDYDLLNPQEFTPLPFVDSDVGGNSISRLQREGTSLNITSILKNGVEFPYSGVQYYKNDLVNYDLEDYKVYLKMKVNHDFRLSLRMNQVLEGYSDTAQPLTCLVLVKTFGLQEGNNEFSFPVKDINEVPEWWFDYNPKMKDGIHKITYDKTFALWLNTERTTPLNKELDIEIQEFTLQHSQVDLIYKSSLIAFLYYIALLFAMWRSKKEKYIIMPIEHSKIEDSKQNQEQDVFTFIGSNFSNPELKQTTVSDALGITQKQLADVIKDKTDFSFRQYLNQIRMEEAKRLLKESDYQIAEVGYKVGYNNVQHFHRVFKEYAGKTPKEFREMFV